MSETEKRDKLEEQNEDKVAEVQDEQVENSASQNEESVEEATSEKEDKSKENENVQSNANTPEAKIEQAKKLVESADREVNECLITVKKDIEEFEEYEKNSLEPIISESRSLLNKIGIDDEEIGELPPVKADISNIESGDKMYVNRLSSGRGGAFFWGLLGGAATLAGWCAFASAKAGVAMDPSKMDMATINKLSSTLAETIGFGSNSQVGLGIAVGSALLIFIIIYSIKVSLQTAKNEEIAKETQEKAKEYSNKKKECKTNLENIDKHIRDLKDVALRYEVLLDEKNAMLRRAIRIEGVDNIDNMHEITKKEIEHMITLIKEIERLIEAPVTENGVLNQDSVALLNETKTLLQKHIDNIYN